MNEKLDERMNELEERMKKLEERVNYLERVIKQGELPQFKKETLHKKSLAEFIKEKNPKSGPDTTLCIGYYLQYVENYNSFTSEEIKKGYKKIYKSLPKNPTDTIQKNVRKGFMEKTEEGKDGKKSWYVTEEGKKYVERMGRGEIE
jgi:type II secretory pathway component PulJ